MLQHDTDDFQLRSLVRKQILVAAVQIVGLTVKLTFKHHLLIKGTRIFGDVVDCRAGAGSLERLVVLEIQEMLQKVQGPGWKDTGANLKELLMAKVGATKWIWATKWMWKHYTNPNRGSSDKISDHYFSKKCQGHKDQERSQKTRNYKLQTEELSQFGDAEELTKCNMRSQVVPGTEKRH